MAAPAYVNAGTGVVIASGSGACTLAGTTAGNIIILQVLRDGTASAVTLSAITNLENLAGTDNALTDLALLQPVGSPTAAAQSLYIGRSLGGTVSVTVATAGDDLYYRLYEFSGVAAAPVVTVDNSVGTVSSVTIGASTGGAQRAQSFVPTVSSSVVTVELWLRKSGSPADNLIVELRPDDAGAPSATVLATASVSAASLTSTFAAYSFALPATVSSGTPYWIVAYRSGAIDSLNYCGWLLSTAAYADGAGKYWNGSVWSAPQADQSFRVTAGATLAAVTESIANGVGTGTTVSDTGVTTTAADRLALQFVAVNDDLAVGPFTGMTGGTWAEAVAEFASATGTDGCIQLQQSVIGLLNNSPGLGGTGWGFGGAVTSKRLATPFVASASGTLNSVEVNLKVIAGAPADDVVVEIQTDAAGVPSGTVVGTSVSVNPTLTSFVSFVCNVNAAIVSGTSYWVVIRRTVDLTDAANYYAANTVASGVAMSRYATSTWTPEPSVSIFTIASLQIGMPSAGTIDGGTLTMASGGWGVVGLALIPPAAVAAVRVPRSSGANFQDPGVF